MNFWEQLKNDSNYTVTENGAIAYKSTNDACLDAFGSLGAMRKGTDYDIIHTFSKAFAENRAVAMRMLFYMRDIRGGQGCRRVFRIIWKWLAETQPKYVIKNLDNILKFGRGDDILCLFDTQLMSDVADWVKDQLHTDAVHATAGEEVSLLAKWLPSENASSAATRAYARSLIKEFGWTPKYYRKVLSALRKYIQVVERSMSAKKWTAINYNTVPSKASMLYSDAFFKHDPEGYGKYIANIANGSAKVNAGALYPVDIIHKFINIGAVSHKDRMLYDAMWKALPDYFAGKEETGICVVDTSGSMYGTPLEVAISLGMYCADKCKGPFAGHFITFSNRPELVDIVGADIVDKVHNISRANWDMNTNLEAVFDLLLNTAIRHKTPASEMPNKLYIISDMQFDEASESYYERRKPSTFMERMKNKYAQAGYEMPIIVYWNVRASECGMFQATYGTEQCCMVSGYSSSLFKAVIEGTTYDVETSYDAYGNTVQTLKAKVDPMSMMLNTLGNERYDSVWVG